jgi:lipoprotein-anchoring transpeptidase ErfK/SrfK
MSLRLTSFLALAAALVGGVVQADPLVARRIYYNTPDSTDATLPDYQSAPVAMPAAAYAPAPARGDLGGGFIEMLVTGASPSPRHAYVAPPPRQQIAYAGAAVPMEARREVDPTYMRTEVAFSGEAPGTIVIDTPTKFLYYVQPGGHAIRYGIGVGRPGFEWSGSKTISRKAEWPDWTPPSEMLKRRPDLPHFMPGGPANPLGARALYLGSSLYRIHGTNEPYTIGQNVSSGCIRMMNDDVTDLYNRVHVGTHVIVR